MDTETVARAAAGDRPERLASAARPPVPMLVGIMDDDGRLLGTGERGEIVLRGRLVVSEYLDLPEATAEVHAHGWHHTGDVGFLEEDGFLYVVDRKKDMVITGGFNVFTAGRRPRSSRAARRPRMRGVRRPGREVGRGSPPLPCPSTGTTPARTR